MRRILFYIKALIYVSLFSVGIGGYVLYYFSSDLPDYAQLADYNPASVTRFYSRDGKLLEEYSHEHRIFVPISSIPKSLIEAFVAAEDKNFYTHMGIDFLSITRAAIRNAINIFENKRMGGSTITQQVVKNMLLTKEKSFVRKAKEAILAYKITKAYSKDKIMELYLNDIFLGKRSHGVASAALNYFNKSIDDLTLEEAAFLAGLPKAPSIYNIEKNYEMAKTRRDYVIRRMYEEGYINKERAEKAFNSKLVFSKRSESEVVKADAYAEHVRKELIEKFGDSTLYNNGLTVITSLDSKIQDWAAQAFRKGIRSFDMTKGYRGAIANIKIDNLEASHLFKKIKVPEALYEFKLSIIYELSSTQAKILLKDGTKSFIPVQEMKWARASLTSPSNILKIGDVVVVEKVKDHYGLRQIPQVNGAMVVMDPNSGEIYAMIGGYHEGIGFNRVTQALRQPGSVFKPLVYLSALEAGYRPDSMFDDAPISISQGQGMPDWRPKNYKGDFLGRITMQTGLEKSRNLITVRLTQALGLPRIKEITKRFGINENPPHFFSIVLGSMETNLYKMSNAYASMINGGKKISPSAIELVFNRKGEIIYNHDRGECVNCKVQEGKEAAIPEYNKFYEFLTDSISSYNITSMLIGAVQRGTAARAKKFGENVGGKTGTTNDSLDTWFIGFTRNLLVGIYVGYDQPKTLGARATGSSVALPIFINFMEEYSKENKALPFRAPDNLDLYNNKPSSPINEDFPEDLQNYDTPEDNELY